MACVVVFILLAAGTLPAGAFTGQGLLPEGLVMEETFSPGRGRSVGRLQVVLGDAVIIHAGKLTGYRAERGLRLYNGDTLITLEDGKLRFRMNDGSILSLSSETKLTLNKSVYQKKSKERASFMSMAFGKARFLVVKLLDFKHSEFKVKTPTAVCGVRGSDFILEAEALETVASALENTEIEIQSLEYPDEKPVILKDFEMSKVAKGQRPTRPMKLSPEEIQRKKAGFGGVESDSDDAKSDDEDVSSDAEVDDSGVDDAGELAKDLDLEDFEELEPDRRLVNIPDPEPIIPRTDPDDENTEALKVPAELPGFPGQPQ